MIGRRTRRAGAGASRLCIGRRGRVKFSAMKEPRLAIGGLLLPEVPGWRFAERDDEVVGRPPGGLGTMRILHVPQEVMSQPVTHDFCMWVIRAVFKIAANPATDREMKES